ncbi:MAG: tripartite tricarboxylate transporter permease [Opitutaceae bacterium]|nr:tripartite tricarboxylate transporter permease [Opitutaceae bacterium]
MMIDLFEGLLAVLQWKVLGFLAVGVLLGVIFGALPGLTATMGVAVLTPLTFWVSPEQGLAMLLGIYCGAIPAGGIPAILINVPGTPASIATAWDGYPLAKRGEAGLALGINALMSGLGQLVSIFFLAVAAFPIARFALKFGPAEYFALAVFGISLMAGVSGGRVVKGMLAGALGLAVAMIGLDPITAYPRYTYGRAEFMDGIAFVPVMIGLFGLTEVFAQISDHVKKTEAEPAKIGRIWPRWQELRRMWPAATAGVGIGTAVGVIPAAGGDIGSVIAWDQARRLSRNKDQFGKGSIEGLAASCTSSNSTVGGSMTTMLALGIPGDAPAAVLIGALLIHGIQPGPLLFRDHRDFVFSIVFLMMFAAVLAMVIGLVGAKPVARVIRLPDPWIWVGIILIGVVGSFALSNSLTDVWVMFAAGLIGFALRKADFPLGPLVLGLILGPMMESNLRRALILNRDDWFGTLTNSPLALFLLIAAMASLVLPLLKQPRKQAKQPSPRVEA